MAVAAAVDFTPVRLLRKAIATAASLAQGKVISSPAELAVVVDDRPAHAAGSASGGCQRKKTSGRKVRNRERIVEQARRRARVARSSARAF